MEIKRALEIRQVCMTRVKDLYYRAVSFGMPSSSLNVEYNEIFAKLPKKTPGWVRSYCDGARVILNDNLYRHHLIFLFIAPDKTLIDTDQMPEGWSHQRINDERLQSGHFWKESHKPFFIGED
jgi:hypothetical protein